METFLIIFLTIFVLAGLIGHHFISDPGDNFIVTFFSILVVISVSIIFIVQINSKEKTIKSEKLVYPKIEIIKTIEIKNIDTIVTNDTSYHYIFENN